MNFFGVESLPREKSARGFYFSSGQLQDHVQNVLDRKTLKWTYISHDNTADIQKTNTYLTLCVKGSSSVRAGPLAIADRTQIFRARQHSRVLTAQTQSAEPLSFPVPSLRQQGMPRPSQQPAHARATTLKLRGRVSLLLGTAVVLVGDS